MVDEDLEVTVGHRSLATVRHVDWGPCGGIRVDPAARISALAKEEDLDSDD